MFRQVDLARNDYHATLESTLLLTSRMAYNANGNPQYLGHAAPGADPAATNWLIREIIYDGSQRVIAMLFASGTANFDKSWNDRATYTYS